MKESDADGDKRDELTRKLFDESKVQVVDKTEGAMFTAWFEGNLARIARLSGAPANSTVVISTIEKGFKLAATGENIEGEMVRLILQREAEAKPFLFIENAAFALPAKLRKQKIGVRSVAIELLEAQRTQEFAHVDVTAIGNIKTLNPDDPSNQYSGYAVWPQLGFDGPLPQALKDRHPELKPFASVCQVLASPGGLQLWLDFGDSCDLRFDLTEGSASWVVLNRYMRDNGIQVER